MFASSTPTSTARIDDHVARPRTTCASFLVEAEISSRQLRTGTLPRHHDPADDRRDRHHLVRDRRFPVAPGRRPATAAAGCRRAELMGTAVENCCAYAPVTMARLVARNFDFHRHPLKEGD